jgi:hypothetical protein
LIRRWLLLLLLLQRLAVAVAAAMAIAMVMAVVALRKGLALLRRHPRLVRAPPTTHKATRWPFLLLASCPKQVYRLPLPCPCRCRCYHFAIAVFTTVIFAAAVRVKGITVVRPFTRRAAAAQLRPYD